MTRKLLSVAVCGLIVCGANGADYVWKGGKDTSWVGVSWEPVGGGTKIAPVAGNDYWQTDDPNRAKADNGKAFPEATLHIGADADSPTGGAAAGNVTFAGTAYQTRTIEFFDLVWHNGMIWGNAANAAWDVSGNVKIVQNSSGATHVLKVSNASQRMTLSADVESDVNAVLTLGAAVSGFTLDKVMSSLSVKGVALSTTLSGDFSKFKGSFDTAAFNSVIFKTDNPLGDPDTPNVSAMLLETDAVIGFDGDFAQSANRGFDVVGTRAYLMTWETIANAYTVKYPIKGTGDVIKHGPGIVTLAGAYTAGDIEVKAGGLVLDAAASIPNGQKFTVRSGASLLSHVSTNSFDIACEEGGTVVYEPPSLVVEYDAETHTVVEPIQLGSGYSTGGVVQPVSLSTCILPFDETQVEATLRLDVLKIAAGANDVTGDDFADASPKTYGLPLTSFEVTKDGSGAQTVTLVVRPYAQSTAACTPTDPIETTTNWTNGKKAQEGWDYLLVHTGIHQAGQFEGDTLTVAGVLLREDNKSANGLTANLRLAEGASIRRNGNNSAKYAGDWTILDAPIEKAAALVAYGASKDYAIDLQTTIAGSGPLVLRSNVAGHDNLVISLMADNSGYTGSLNLSCEASGTTADYAKHGVIVKFSSANNLGGALSDFVADATLIDRYSYLWPTASVTLDTANRGLTVCSGGFYVPADVALTLAEPLTVEGQVIKEGAGDLILNCSTTAATAKELTVRGGVLKPLTADCCANLDVVFANAYASAPATLAIDGSCAAIEEDGLVARSLAAAEAGQKIPVRIENPWKNGVRKSRTIGICTLTEDKIGSVDAFDFGRVRGAKVTPSRVELEGGRVRYEARITAQGLFLVVK